MGIGIKYVGAAEEFTDRLYGTGLTWKPGVVHHIEDTVAKRMLEHSDTYARGVIPKGSPLVRFKPHMSEREIQENNHPPMLDLSKMTERELRDMSELYYGERLPPHMTKDNMMARVVSYYHRNY